MKPIPPIAPVFDRRYQAVAFILFCSITVMAPFVVSSIPVERRYESIPWNLGNYSFIREQIFESNGPIDILFLGPSAVWAGVEPTIVQEALGQRVHRQATVLNFGVDFYGHEAAYFLLRDTLERRAVRVVALGVPSPQTSAPHLVTPYLADIRRDGVMTRGLPWQSRVTLYTASIVGAPKALLGVIRNNSGLNRFSSGKHEFSRLGQGQHYDTRALATADPATILANEPAPAGGETILSKGDPRLDEMAPAPHQAQLLRAIAALCSSRGARLLLLRVPLQTDDGVKVALAADDLLGGQLKVIAPIPHFIALPPERRAPYYRNAGHLNYRGSVVFTSAAVPALLQAYEEHVN